jgi:hypothetical protein
MTQEMRGRVREHSVILTFPVAAVGTVQIPDPGCRYTWHSAGLTCDYYFRGRTRERPECGTRR